ncbi:MAG: hypothetical protein K1Y36_11390 [Blastocatellia bacterium]|nr:hypothetical protein [Blastocatellia bacterium]
MELPRSLARWGPLLKIFPRETIAALGPLIQRLDVLVGPLQIGASTGQGEPDGFDGIHRRGSYERLLNTEWLLADELPEEFLRRATEGEHLFLQTATRTPAGARRSVVLFDAGPNQLGAPRIVHLAALVVLASRAGKGSTSFEWGIAQAVQAPLVQDVTENSVRHLLTARSPFEVTEENLRHWRQQLGGTNQTLDFWLVGGERLQNFEASRGVSFLTVTDPLEPNERFLAVTIQTARKKTESVRLDLPDERASVRLLRDPFEAAAVSTPSQKNKSQYQPVSNFQFAFGGSKLFARAADGGVVSFPIPNSAAAGMGKPKLWHSQSGKPVLAAIRHKKTLVLVSEHGHDTLRVECVKSGSTFLPFRVGDYLLDSQSSPFLTTAKNSLLHSGVIVPVSETQSEILLLDGTRHLFTLRQNNSLLSCTCQTGDVLALGAFLTGTYGASTTKAVYVCQKGAEFRIVSQGLNQDPQTRKWYPERSARTVEGEGQQAFIGFGNTHLQSLVALEQFTGKWVVVGDSNYFFQQPSGTRVVGVIGRLGRWNGSSPGLIVVEDDNRTIWLLGKDWSRTLPRAGAEIVEVKVCETTPHLAYLTADGEVVVYSFGLEAVVLRYLAENR